MQSGTSPAAGPPRRDLTQRRVSAPAGRVDGVPGGGGEHGGGWAQEVLGRKRPRARERKGEGRRGEGSGWRRRTRRGSFSISWRLRVAVEALGGAAGEGVGGDEGEEGRRCLPEPVGISRRQCRRRSGPLQVSMYRVLLPGNVIVREVDSMSAPAGTSCLLPTVLIEFY
ncbi:uncharacterized protein A4U43_C02F20320 [Asparagus officinalis]|uniref:Uncharacterized protein n=1 Tax=Asparagus officinalis TaxID=4686 RepID=A0A5P1FPG7_ASPOF|nr:uncharacterized protein A4U43_C02F20320 [Asparagus officinalis]